MKELSVHADRTQPAIVHGFREPWRPSPEPGVDRRVLERIGGEVALASSIVRYRPGSRFAPHTHELGEEFLVLDGLFSDEFGHYPAGTYVRNAPGSRHAPFSESGCVIFVKLRQMDPADRISLRVFPDERVWRPTRSPGHQRATLFDAGGVTIHLEKLAPGVTVPSRRIPGGEEVFVVEGRICAADAARTILESWGWIRRADGRAPRYFTPHGALLWIKRGHLAGRVRTP